MTMTDITPILQAVISVCTTIITAFAIPWIRAKAGQAMAERLYTATLIAVRAAEQIYGEGEGKKKAEYVMKYLNKHGFRLSPEELRNSLEAAVLELNTEIYGPSGET